MAAGAEQRRHTEGQLFGRLGRRRFADLLHEAAHPKDPRRRYDRRHAWGLRGRVVVLSHAEIHHALDLTNLVLISMNNLFYL